MREIFQPGDQKTFERKVTDDDTARFEQGQVHPVFSTFALARDAEWTCRLFVLEMKEDDEEGIGTEISVKHQAPAFVGELVRFTATVDKIEDREVICSYEARVGERLVAMGTQGQKILQKEVIEQRFRQLQQSEND